jgi:CrcB protein
MPLILWVAIGGAIGSAVRHLVNVASLRALGANFPWGTFFVNVAGCFIMGIIAGLLAARLSASSEVRSFLTTGILGGFTTFSAFSLDFALLVERRDFLLAAAYCLGSVGLSIAGVFAGLWLVRHVYSW